MCDIRNFQLCSGQKRNGIVKTKRAGLKEPFVFQGRVCLKISVQNVLPAQNAADTRTEGKLEGVREEGEKLPCLCFKV